MAWQCVVTYVSNLNNSTSTFGFTQETNSSPSTPTTSLHGLCHSTWTDFVLCSCYMTEDSSQLGGLYMNYNAFIFVGLSTNSKWEQPAKIRFTWSVLQKSRLAMTTAFLGLLPQDHHLNIKFPKDIKWCCGAKGSNPKISLSCWAIYFCNSLMAPDWRLTCQSW